MGEETLNGKRRNKRQKTARIEVATTVNNRGQQFVLHILFGFESDTIRYLCNKKTS